MRKKNLFPLIKLINVIMVLLPFIGCWFLYYEPRTLTVHSRQVSVLVMIVFCIIYYFFCHMLDGFRTSILPIREIVMSQMLVVMITDAISYIVIWMLSIHLPNILPGVCALAIQILMTVIWAVAANRIYFKGHKPQKTAIIYDVRQGMENVIHAYGMEYRFHVEHTWAIEEVLEHPELMKEVETVFLCGIHSHDRNIVLKYCTNNNIKMYIIPRVGDVMMSGAERIHMFHLPILRSQRYNPSAEYKIIKRTFDIVASGLALIILSPVMLVTAIAIKRDGGPAIYRQKRLTKDGKVFEILKFRSMCVDAEKYSGAVLSAGESDPRITKVGRIIRACRIDELPQLINILKGDMSVVGPRPERPEIAAEYEKELPEFRLRLQAKAGLTGYAQVYGKYNTTPYDKLLLDLMYISKANILEDMIIILATLKILTSKESTEGVGENAAEMKYEEREKREQEAV